MSNRRRRPVGLTTKLTAEEYATLKTRAGTRTVSEWARETLLAAAHNSHFLVPIQERFGDGTAGISCSSQYDVHVFPL